MSTIFQYPHGPLGPDATPQDKSGDVTDVPYLGIYTAETTKRYVYGTRHITWDGRVFKYGLATNTVSGNSVGIKGEAAVAVSYTALLATSAAGATSIYIDAGGAAALAEDALEAGYAIIYNAATSTVCMRCITGNSLSDSSGYTYIYFDGQPLPYEHTTSYYCEICYSPYSNMKYRGAAGDAYGSVLGVPVVITSAANNYIWIQTWGPMWLAPQSPIGTSSLGAHNRQLTFRPDGAIDEHNYEETYNTKAQHAGFLLTYSTAGSDGPPLIMLQISI